MWEVTRGRTVNENNFGEKAASFGMWMMKELPKGLRLGNYIEASEDIVQLRFDNDICHTLRNCEQWIG